MSERSTSGKTNAKASAARLEHPFVSRKVRQSNLSDLPIERTQQLVDTSHDIVLVSGSQIAPSHVITIGEKLTITVATGDALSHVLNLNLQRPATSGTAFYKVSSSYHLGTSCYLEQAQSRHEI